MKTRAFENILILDHSLIDYRAHTFNFVRDISRAAQACGLGIRIYGAKGMRNEIKDELNAIPFFNHDIWYRFDKRLPIIAGTFLGRFINVLLANISFFLDLLRLDKFAKSQTSIIFCPFFHNRQAIAWALWALWQSRIVNLKIVLNMTNLPALEKKKFNLRNLFFIFYLRSLWYLNKNIRIIMETERGALAIQKHTRIPVSFIPIPKSMDELARYDSTLSTSSNKIVRFSMVGGLREVKGFDIFAEALMQLRKKIEPLSILFCIQCYTTVENKRLSEIYKNLESLEGEKVELIKRDLEPNEYFKLIAASDLLIFPYQKDHYTAKTSGVLIEALALGKPVIVTEDTWLSEQVLGKGVGLTFVDRDAESLANAILLAYNSLGELSKRASANKASVREKHSPGQYIQNFLALFS